MKIGFIGSGNMGGAIAAGIIRAGIAESEDLIVADISEKSLEKMRSTYGVKTTTDNKAAAAADILFLAVKPNVIFNVIDEIKDTVGEDTTVVSIAAGRDIASIEQAFAKPVKLIRVMPNTPALVGEGMAALSLNSVIADEKYADDVAAVVKIFESLGKCEIVPERLMDAVTGVSGSSPAYVFMFIEAMADAAVQGGMPRAQAYTFAAQSVLGSAKMVLETGKHPAELKDMVCSPAGTTIDAVAALEKNGMRAAVMEAVRVCIEKSRSL